MKFTNLLTKTVIVSRLMPVAGFKGKSIWATATTTLECEIQQVDAEKAVNIGGAVGKTFILFADADANLEDGDKLKDENGQIYQVKAGGVSIKTLGSIDHMEVLVEKVND